MEVAEKAVSEEGVTTGGSLRVSGFIGRKLRQSSATGSSEVVNDLQFFVITQRVEFLSSSIGIKTVECKAYILGLLVRGPMLLSVWLFQAADRPQFPWQGLLTQAASIGV